MKKQTIIKQTNRWAIHCLAVLGTAGLCLPALASADELESGEPVTQADQADSRPVISVTTGVSSQAKTDIDNGGDVSITRFNAGVTVPFHLNEELTLVTSARYALDSYEFGDGPNPWHNINNLTGVALLQSRLDDHWMVYGGGILRVSAESGADWGDATQGGGVVGVNYIMNETLSFGGGLVAISQIEDDASVIPIPTANWKFAENWKLTLGVSDLATAGYGLNVTWDCCENWKMVFGVQAHKSRFRIDANDGVGQEQAVLVSAAAVWTPNKTFSGTAFLGVANGGELTLDDSSGNEISSEDYDSALVVGLKAGFRF